MWNDFLKGNRFLANDIKRTEREIERERERERNLVFISFDKQSNGLEVLDTLMRNQFDHFD